MARAGPRPGGALGDPRAEASELDASIGTLFKTQQQQVHRLRAELESAVEQEALVHRLLDLWSAQRVDAARGETDGDQASEAAAFTDGPSPQGERTGNEASEQAAPGEASTQTKRAAPGQWSCVPTALPQEGGEPDSISVKRRTSDRSEADRKRPWWSELRNAKQPARRGSQMGRASTLSLGTEMNYMVSMTSSSELQVDTRSTFEKIILSDRFELLMGSVIVCNFFTMAVETQYSGMEIGELLGFPRVGRAPSGWDVACEMANNVFFGIYVAEILLRMAAQKWRWLRSGWNWFDLTLVVLTPLLHARDVSATIDPLAIRILRIGRLCRCLRVVKGVHLVDSWEFLLKSLSASKVTLFWSFVLLFTIKAIFAVLISQTVAGYLVNESNEDSERRRVFKYYGTFTKSFITMFEITHVNYSNSMRTLSDNIAEEFAWLIIMYRMFVSFAVLNVIRAIFIQQTMQVAERDHALMIAAKVKQTQNNERKLKRLFHEMDADQNESLDLVQFKCALQSPEMKTWMAALDIHITDEECVFKLLDKAGKGGLTAEEFIAGAQSLRGTAKAVDMLEAKEYIHELLNATQRCERTLSRVERCMSSSDAEQCYTI